MFTFYEMGKGQITRAVRPDRCWRDENREVLMGLADKAKKAEELAGKGKAAAGDATDNRDLEAEGRMQESKADLKQAGENVKDTGDDVADASVASGAQKGDDDRPLR